MIAVAKIPGFYTIQQAAPLLERCEATVTRYCQEGKLDAIFTGAQWLIKRAAVDSFKKPRRGNPNWVKGYANKSKKSRK